MSPDPPRPAATPEDVAEPSPQHLSCQSRVLSGNLQGANGKSEALWHQGPTPLVDFLTKVIRTG